jgi:hypothetical protein
MPFVRRTRATLRKAEFGFLGVVVYTRVQTPRRCGHACRAGVFLRLITAFRSMRISWLMVGITSSRKKLCQCRQKPKGNTCIHPGAICQALHDFSIKQKIVKNENLRGTLSS